MLQCVTCISNKWIKPRVSKMFAGEPLKEFGKWSRAKLFCDINGGMLGVRQSLGAGGEWDWDRGAEGLGAQGS